MAKKITTYIDVDLEWAEEQLRTWKDYIDNNPISELEDRYDLDGRRVVSNIEQQGKYIQETMKNYLSLLREIDSLREKEDEKEKKIRGKENLSPLESDDI